MHSNVGKLPTWGWNDPYGSMHFKTLNKKQKIKKFRSGGEILSVAKFRQNHQVPSGRR